MGSFEYQEVDHSRLLVRSSCYTVTTSSNMISCNCNIGRPKTTEPIDLPFGLLTPVSRRKHKFNRIRQVAPMCPRTLCRELCENGWTDRDAVWVEVSVGPGNHVGGHIGATWQIRWNRPSAAVMRPYVKLLWSLVIIIIVDKPCDCTGFPQCYICNSTSKRECEMNQQLITCPNADVSFHNIQ